MRHLFLLPVCLLAAAGCGGGPKLVPVEGRVVYKDRPVTAATVWFIPDAARGGQGQKASCLLGEDGSFKLGTFPHGKGAVAGPYKVTFSFGARGDKALFKYARPETTTLEVDVPPDGKTDLLLSLN